MKQKGKQEGKQVETEEIRPLLEFWGSPTP